MIRSNPPQTGRTASPAGWRQWSLLGLLLVLFGSVLAHFALTVHPRFHHRADSVDTQKAIIERRPFVMFTHWGGDCPSWRSRVFAPLAIDAIAAVTDRSFSQSYVAFRWLSAVLALAAFALLVERQLRGGPLLAGGGAALLAAILLPTFLHIYDIASDFPDAAFFALLVLLAAEKRRILFVTLLLVAAANRESALFGTIVWFALHGFPWSRRNTLRESIFCFAAGGLGIAVITLLRLRFAMIAPAGDPTAMLQPASFVLLPSWPFRDLVQNFYFGHPMLFFIGYVALFAGGLWTYWRDLSGPLRRMALAGAAIFGLSLPFTNLPELRSYIPSLVVCAFLTTAILRNRMMGPLSNR